MQNWTAKQEPRVRWLFSSLQWLKVFCWSPLPEEIFLTAHWPHFICDIKTTLLHLLLSRSDYFSPLSRRDSPHGAKRLVTAEAEGNGTAWKRSGAASHAMLLLSSEFVSHLHAVFGSSISYVLDSQRLLENDAARWTELSALALSLWPVSLFA